MKFDFDTPVDRRETNSYKWDTLPEEGLIPLWVADMDFRTAPCIIEALKKRVEHGVFGYTAVPDSYYDSVIRWFGSRHSLNLNKEEIIYTSGVVPAISAIIKALAKPGDKVVVQTPVYNCFFSSIHNNDCIASENPLIFRNGTFYIDFEDLERRLAEPEAKLMLLCNPHNPAGRVWTREELTKIGELCIRHDVTVISDDIHCELVYKPYVYTPFASISEEFHEKSVTCASPSKAFNIAGLQIANIFAKNQEVRNAIDKAININEVCDVNPFGVIALQEAYNNGLEWLEEVKEYIYRNYEYLSRKVKTELPDFTLARLEGTYLAWLDCSVLNTPSSKIADYLMKEWGVYVNSGDMYHDPSDRFIRINLATSKSVLREGIDKIIKGLLCLKNS